MKYVNSKELLENIVSEIKVNLSDVINNKEVKDTINVLQQDMANEFFTIVVLGEFKRGKSTFINSLIGEKLLPSDVTPTTATINALMYSDEKNIEVLKQDGQIERGEATLSYLEKYTASYEFDVDNIKYLKVGYNAEILKENIVLVDTPGVSDINEQRVKVTYDFIPRADAVIFLLDATSPIKKTEKEFIEEHLIKIGIDKILFIANRFDDIDEEDEEEVLEDIKLRLKSAFKEGQQDGLKEIKVLPMSSRLALEGIINNNLQLVEESNLNEVKKQVKDVIEHGKKGQEKIYRYKNRVLNILNKIEKEINSEEALYKADSSKLNEILSKTRAVISNEEKRKHSIKEYVENQKQDILLMTNKSLNYLYDSLKDEMNDAIDNYKGTDFKEYVERQIATSVKRNIQRWINIYTPSIDKTLVKLEAEICKSLANYFRNSITVKNSNVSGIDLEFNNSMLYIEAQDISNVTTKAGLISAGAASVALLAGGAFILPFMSMAAFPILQRSMLENKLKEAKLEVKPQVNLAIKQCIDSLKDEINNNINTRANAIEKDVEERFNILFNEFLEKITSEINERETRKISIDEKIEIINNKKIYIKEVINQVKNI